MTMGIMGVRMTMGRMGARMTMGTYLLQNLGAKLHRIFCLIDAEHLAKVKI